MPQTTPQPTRPAPDSFVGVRMPDSLIDTIDNWRWAEGKLSRSEAIRRLVTMGLGVGDTDDSQ